METHSLVCLSFALAPFGEVAGVLKVKTCYIPMEYFSILQEDTDRRYRMQNMCILTVSLPLNVPLPWVNILEGYSVKIVFLFPSSKLSALLHIPKDLIIIIICFQLNAFCTLCSSSLLLEVILLCFFTDVYVLFSAFLNVH